MNYSICFLDGLGRTLRSEFDPFEHDDDAVTYGRTGLPGSEIVEVWKGEHLLARLFHDRATVPAYAAKTISASQRRRVSNWENEGGATSLPGVARAV